MANVRRRANAEGVTMSQKNEKTTAKPFGIDMLEDLSPEQLSLVNGGSGPPVRRIHTYMASWIGPNGTTFGDF
jgi:hypothetical protein